MGKISRFDVGKILLGCMKLIAFPALLLGIGLFFVYVVGPSIKSKPFPTPVPTPYSETDEEYEQRMLIDEANYLGYGEGYADGLDKGMKDGYENGYNDGYDEGRDSGYSLGFEESRRQVLDTLQHVLYMDYGVDLCEYFDLLPELP